MRNGTDCVARKSSKNNCRVSIMESDQTVQPPPPIPLKRQRQRKPPQKEKPKFEIRRGDFQVDMHIKSLA